MWWVVRFYIHVKYNFIYVDGVFQLGCDNDIIYNSLKCIVIVIVDVSNLLNLNKVCWTYKQTAFTQTFINELLYKYVDKQNQFNAPERICILIL